MRFKIISLLVFISFAFFSCKNAKTGETVQPEGQKEGSAQVAQDTTLAFDPATLSEEPVFDIVTSEGTIRVKLYKETPLHRDNFIKLASERFYDNILFHRVIKDFMIQVGDPYTKDPAVAATQYGTGGPGYTIPAEILPQFKHKKGALAAARRPDTSNPNRESSGSQFYIVESPESCAQLDGDYSVFGETVSGLDVVDKIANAPTAGGKNLPVNPIKIISITPVKE